MPGPFNIDFDKNAGETKFFKSDETYAFYANTYPGGFEFKIALTPGSAEVETYSLACLENAYQALKVLGRKPYDKEAYKVAHALMHSKTTGGDSAKAGRKLAGASGPAVGVNGNKFFYDLPFDPSQIFDESPSPRYRTVKEQVMKDLLLCKFTQNPELLALLLNDNKRITENTRVRKGINDSFWGNGWEGDGRNALGQLLMEIRGELRNEMNLGGVRVRTGLSDETCARLNIGYIQHLHDDAIITPQELDAITARPLVQQLLEDPSHENFDRILLEKKFGARLQAGLQKSVNDWLITGLTQASQSHRFAQVEMVQDTNPRNDKGVLLIKFNNKAVAEEFASHAGYKKSGGIFSTSKGFVAKKGDDGLFIVPLGPDRAKKFLLDKGLVQNSSEAILLLDSLREERLQAQQVARTSHAQKRGVPTGLSDAEQGATHDGKRRAAGKEAAGSEISTQPATGSGNEVAKKMAKQLAEEAVKKGNLQGHTQPEQGAGTGLGKK